MSKISLGESLMKEVLDKLFLNEPYQDNIRPNWLKGLELDRFYPELDLAFEYQGSQHDYFIPDFHNDEMDAYKQRMHDEYKERICHGKNIILVKVYPSKLGFGRIQYGISEQLRSCEFYLNTKRIRKLITIPRDRNLEKRCRAYRNLIKSNFAVGKWKRGVLDSPDIEDEGIFELDDIPDLGRSLLIKGITVEEDYINET